MLGAISLAGCGVLWDSDEEIATQQTASTHQRLDKVIEEGNACAAKKQSGEFKTNVAVAMCVNRAVQTGLFDLQYPYPDLVASLSAERVRVAESVDKKEISDAEAIARLEEKISEVTRIQQARLAPLEGSDSDEEKDKARRRTLQLQYYLRTLQVGL